MVLTNIRTFSAVEHSQFSLVSKILHLFVPVKHLSSEKFLSFFSQQLLWHSKTWTSYRINQANLRSFGALTPFPVFLLFLFDFVTMLYNILFFILFFNFRRSLRSFHSLNSNFVLFFNFHNLFFNFFIALFFFLVYCIIIFFRIFFFDRL